MRISDWSSYVCSSDLFMPVAQSPIEDYRLVMDVNLLGPLLGMQTVIPRMLQRGCGSIVNISSVNGLAGSPGLGAYAASKHGLIGLSRCAAMELGHAGIRVNVVCPGGVGTPMISEHTSTIGRESGRESGGQSRL